MILEKIIFAVNIKMSTTTIDSSNISAPDDPNSLITPNDLTFLQISQRAYKYIRQFSIKDINDAIVELVTNADDAYTRSDLSFPHVIYISYDESNYQLKVSDNATGLRAADMSRCFLQVGNYTSTDGSRGFFSRGAKDVSILGNVYFESICQGYYSKCMINSDAEGGMLVSDQLLDPSDPLYQTLGIRDNGLCVTVALQLTYRPSTYQTLKYNIEKRAHLRDILANPDTRVFLSWYNVARGLINKERIQYQYPDVDYLALDIIYEVPNYPGVQARFVMNKSLEPIIQPFMENQMEFGFLIKSGNAIHEVSTLDNSKFRWNQYMPYLYGTVTCDYITDLLLQYDIYGATPLNPIAIIDPSRATGLIRDHPFIQSLLQIPIQRLDYQLIQLDGQISANSVTLNDFSEILEEIEQLGLNLLDSLPDSYSKWNENQATTHTVDLIKAIQDDRQEYVITERNYVLDTTDFVYDDPSTMSLNSSASQRNIYLMNNQNQLIQVPSDLLTDGMDNLPLEAVQKIYDNMIEKVNPDDFTRYPYIYSISSTGNAMKLFIFNHGQLENTQTDEINAVINKKKILNITFSRDINLKNRYVLSMNGNTIEIIINLNNPIIAKYLASNSDSTEISDDEITLNMSSLSDLENNKSYIFLSEFFIEIFTRIMLIGKVKGKGIVLDADDTISNINKIYSQRDDLTTSIEQAITTIFDKYHRTNSMKIITRLMNQVSLIVQDQETLESLQNTLTSNFSQII
jgi:hypothetical protein